MSDSSSEPVDILTASYKDLEDLLKSVGDGNADCINTLLNMFYNLNEQLGEEGREDGDPCVLAFEADAAVEAIRGMLYIIYSNNTASAFFDLLSEELVGIDPDVMCKLVVQRLETGIPIQQLIIQYVEAMEAESGSMFVPTDPSSIN